MRNSAFTNSRAGLGGAVYAWDGSSFDIRDSLFAGNHGSAGGAVYLNARSNLILERTTFDANVGSRGGALYLGYGMTTTVRDCVFRSSVSRYGPGGAVHVAGFAPSDFTFADFVHCVFTRNESPDRLSSYSAWGGAISAKDSITTLIDSVVFDNYAGLGGGLYGENTLFYVQNSILRQNVDTEGTGFDAQARADEFTLITMTNSNVQGLTLRDGNIDLDPLFVDPAGADGLVGTEDDDFHLRPGSPCIDAGDNALVPAGVTTDLDGNPRFHDDLPTIDSGAGSPPIVDMGPYEFLRADCDHNWTVDQADFAVFAACLAGPIDPNLPPCGCLDLNADGHVDLADNAAFSSEYAQP